VLSYRVRPATTEDAGFLADMVIEATRAQGRLAPGFDEQRWRVDFSARPLDQVRDQGPDETTSVVEVNNERIGRVRISRTAECIELCGIRLRPGFQRHGIGTAIIEALKARAAAAGIPLDLDVEKDNLDARKLYQRLGFAQIAETDQEFRLWWHPAGPPWPSP
jgi:ribosomal protein S18 acetylase RimI-like enzyme